MKMATNPSAITTPRMLSLAETLNTHLIYLANHHISAIYKQSNSNVTSYFCKVISWQLYLILTLRAAQQASWRPSYCGACEVMNLRATVSQVDFRNIQSDCFKLTVHTGKLTKCLSVHSNQAGRNSPYYKTLPNIPVFLNYFRSQS